MLPAGFLYQGWAWAAPDNFFFYFGAGLYSSQARAFPALNGNDF